MAYGSVTKAIVALRKFTRFTRQLHGAKRRMKIVRCGSRFYYGLYAPAFPSSLFTEYIKGELNRISPVKGRVHALAFIFLAITRKCPLDCEHCFEWARLNGKESFSLDELTEIVMSFQDDGVSQIHFSGGEPLVRMNVLEPLIRMACNKSECWILTSGYNLTLENAKRLRKAGAAGVAISLDHYDERNHDEFRGRSGAFRQAMEAIRNARRAELAVVITLCATRPLVTRDNLMRYAELGRSLGVHFIQLLEPRQAGRYSDKDISLSQEQLDILTDFYISMNYSPAFSDFPVILYHGYHQRKIGCMLAGRRSVYIDSEGWVNSCPFCHTKDYHIRDIIKGRNALHATMSCPEY